LPDAPESAFDELDAAEYRHRDVAAARKLAQNLTKSADPAIRATALVRLARFLRSSAEYERALNAYAEAASLNTVGIAGVPADLFALWARCGLLAELHRDADVRREAEALRRDLLSGRWTLTRPAYELHMVDVSAWAGSAPAPPTPEQRMLTTAVELLFAQLRRDDSAAAIPARLTLNVDRAWVTVLAAADADGVRALVATPSFVERQWISKVTPILQPQNVRLTVNYDGSRTGDAAIADRAASETGLPWSLRVEPLDPAVEIAGIRRRRWLWQAVLITFALLACAGSWIVGRAVSRELAVARLQADFVAAVSHEFRTPLTTMAQLTEMLLDARVQEPRRQRGYFQAIARQTERLRRLVENLLDFGRMEAGRSAYQRRAIDVKAWLELVVEQFRHDAASRGHQVHLDVSGHGGVMVNGDEDALTNALWNVLDNAAKYSPEGSEVWVELRRSEAGVAIDVRDAGIGIPQEEQRAIFGKFVRGARARADRIAGTGLGLAIVEHVLKAHDGTITVRSVMHQGSTFTITLPALQEAAPQCLAS
jgi:signal transduction histidine kinase